MQEYFDYHGQSTNCMPTNEHIYMKLSICSSIIRLQLSATSGRSIFADWGSSIKSTRCSDKLLFLQ
uniref:Uncharacterized protein n=1 Tax=Arundo donax TaxID=35708 RepID=A0A0A9DAN1_ARUDO